MNRMTLCWIIVFWAGWMFENGALPKRISMFINYLLFPCHSRALRAPSAMPKKQLFSVEIQAKSSVYLRFVFHLIYFFSFRSLAERIALLFALFYFVIVIRSDTAENMRPLNELTSAKCVRIFSSKCQFQYWYDDDTPAHANWIGWAMIYVCKLVKRRQFLWGNFTSTVATGCWRLLFMCLGIQTYVRLNANFQLQKSDWNGVAERWSH